MVKISRLICLMTRAVAVDVQGARQPRAAHGVRREGPPTTKMANAAPVAAAIPPPSPPHCLVALRVPAFLPLSHVAR